MSSTEWPDRAGDGQKFLTPNIQHRTSNEETRKAEALKSGTLKPEISRLRQDFRLCGSYGMTERRAEEKSGGKREVARDFGW
jgi:hypothetical protein